MKNRWSLYSAKLFLYPLPFFCEIAIFKWFLISWCLFREASKVCLTDWKKKILSGDYPRDQPALIDAISEGKCTICLLNKELVSYPKSFKNIIGLLPHRPLLHYTTTVHGTKKKIEKNCKETPEIYCYLRHFMKGFYLEVAEKDYC